MKNSITLFFALSLILGLAACSKKDAPGKGAAETKAAAANSIATVEKAVGAKPGIAVAINIKGLKESALYDMFKGQLTDKIGNSECMQKSLETADSMVVFVDNPSKGKKEVPSFYAVVTGIDAKAALACIKQSNPGAKDGKLNGVDALLIEDDDKFGWAGSEKALVVAGGKFAQKLTPGKDELGKGEVKSFCGGKTIAFTVGEIEEIKEASGFIDLSKGLGADVSVTFAKEEKAKEMEEGYSQAKKMAPQAGMGDLIKSVKFSRSGATVSVGISLSADQFKQVMGMAKGMLPM